MTCYRAPAYSILRGRDMLFLLHIIIQESTADLTPTHGPQDDRGVFVAAFADIVRKGE
jgi:hypothetical protein